MGIEFLCFIWGQIIKTILIIQCVSNYATILSISFPLDFLLLDKWPNCISDIRTPFLFVEIWKVVFLNGTPHCPHLLSQGPQYWLKQVLASTEAIKFWASHTIEASRGSPSVSSTLKLKSWDFWPKVKSIFLSKIIMTITRT